MLNDRAQSLLKILIERYIAEGQPVGSRALSKYSGMELSPASIRNVMADLEEMGFITSPHTSAGRVPTPLGYRFFVDTLLTIKPLQQSEVNQLEGQLHPDDPQKLITSASHLLSELTQFAGVVMTPKRRSTAFRHVEFMRLSEKRVLLIIVTAEGDVQNRIIITDKSYTPAQLIEAGNYLNANYAGREFEAVRDAVKKELNQLHSDISQLMQAVVETGHDAQREGDSIVLSGERNLLNVHELSSNMASLRKLFDAFEQKSSLMQLLEISAQAQGVKIFIGGESGMTPLDEFSVVTAPYEVDGKVVGTVGVVGPTRMAYERVIPIVDITAKLLSSALSYH